MTDRWYEQRSYADGTVRHTGAPPIGASDLPGAMLEQFCGACTPADAKMPGPMISEITTGAVGLVGALIGGGFTLGAQRMGDRRTQGHAVWAEHQRCVAALRLTVMDLERSAHRLERMGGDPRGFVELPRGAWLEYRALLAPHLSGQVLNALVEAYNEVIEWNEILWAAFATAAPESFHRSDQHKLDREAAARLLSVMSPRLEQRVAYAATSLRAVQERETARTEREVVPPPTLSRHRAELRRLGAGRPMVDSE